MATPVAEPLRLPSEYGSVTQTLEWETVRGLLVEAKQYWFATVRSGNRPHVVPLDGIWLDDVWYYGGSPETVHARSVLSNPECVLHLPDPWKVVIVEGRVRRTRPDAETAQRLADLSAAKYPDYGLTYSAEMYAEVSALYPERAQAWLSFPRDATRFRFAESQ